MGFASFDLEAEGRRIDFHHYFYDANVQALCDAAGVTEVGTDHLKGYFNCFSLTAAGVWKCAGRDGDGGGLIS